MTTRTVRQLYARSVQAVVSCGIPGSDLEVMDVSAETRLDIDGDTVNAT